MATLEAAERDGNNFGKKDHKYFDFTTPIGLLKRLLKSSLGRMREPINATRTVLST